MSIRSNRRNRRQANQALRGSFVWKGKEETATTPPKRRMPTRRVYIYRDAKMYIFMTPAGTVHVF